MSPGKEEIIVRMRCLSVLVIKKIDNCSPPSPHFEFFRVFSGGLGCENQSRSRAVG